MKTLRTKLFVLVLLGSSKIICAQTNEVDSMLSAIKLAPGDTNKVNSLIDLSIILRGTSIDSAIMYAQQAKDLAVKINYPKGQGYALKSIGICYNILGDYVNAIVTWKEALEIFDKNGLKQGASNMENNIGAAYYFQGDKENAQPHYLRSLQLAEEIHDTLRMGTALVNLGALYSSGDETIGEALYYYNRALILAKVTSDPDLLGTCNVNIGEIYIKKFDEVDSTDEQRELSLDSALISFTEAVSKYETSDNLPYALNAMAQVYQRKKMYDVAISWNEKALKKSQLINSSIDLGLSYYGMAQSYEATENYKLAIENFLKAEEVFLGIGLEESMDIANVYVGLTECYSQINEPGNALKYSILLVKVREKIYNIETDRSMERELVAYEVAQKEAAAKIEQTKKDEQAASELQRQKLLRNGFVGGFAVMLLFAGVFFTQRNKIKRGKKLSDELLLNILPEEVAEELKAKGSAEAQLIDEVTVLFTDFKGFTAISEKLSPKELVKDLNECFSAFDHIMVKHNMEKIKTIGDSYMAAGGLPTANTTHAEDAVKAAIEIRDFIEAGKADKLAKGEPFFEIRIGIHTGPVVAGIVGVKKFAYDIWGDTVNTASRMESSGEVGQVNISETTYALVKDKFNCVSRGKIQAKGKGETEMYFVLNPAIV